MQTYGLFLFVFCILKSYHSPMTSMKGSFIQKFKSAHPSSVQDYNTLLNTKFRSLFLKLFLWFFSIKIFFDMLIAPSFRTVRACFLVILLILCSLLDSLKKIKNKIWFWSFKRSRYKSPFLIVHLLLLISFLSKLLEFELPLLSWTDFVEFLEIHIKIWNFTSP